MATCSVVHWLAVGIVNVDVPKTDGKTGPDYRISREINWVLMVFQKCAGAEPRGIQFPHFSQHEGTLHYQVYSYSDGDGKPASRKFERS